MSQPNVLYIGTNVCVGKIIEYRFPEVQMDHEPYADRALEAIAEERDLILIDPLLAGGTEFSLDRVPGLKEYLAAHNNNAYFEIGKYLLKQIKESINRETPVMIMLTIPKETNLADKLVTSAKGLGFESIYDMGSEKERDKLEADVKKALGL
jgi:hypothetical protein